MLLEITAAGTTPATHAFVLGVSHYPFADGPEATPEGEALGISNLTGAARSASEVAAWLLTEYRNPDAPLRSLTLLLSPVDGEQLHPEVVARMAGQASPATRDAVEVDFARFRNRCRESTDNVASCTSSGTASSSISAGRWYCSTTLPLGIGHYCMARSTLSAAATPWTRTATPATRCGSDACRQRPES